MTVFKELDQQTNLENWRPLHVSGGKAMHELIVLQVIPFAEKKG